MIGVMGRRESAQHCRGMFIARWTCPCLRAEWNGALHYWSYYEHSFGQPFSFRASAVQSRVWYWNRDAGVGRLLRRRLCGYTDFMRGHRGGGEVGRIDAHKRQSFTRGMFRLIDVPRQAAGVPGNNLYPG